MWRSGFPTHLTFKIHFFLKKKVMNMLLHLQMLRCKLVPRNLGKVAWNKIQVEVCQKKYPPMADMPKGVVPLTLGQAHCCRIVPHTHWKTWPKQKLNLGMIFLYFERSVMGIKFLRSDSMYLWFHIKTYSCTLSLNKIFMTQTSC